MTQGNQYDPNQPNPYQSPYSQGGQSPTGYSQPTGYTQPADQRGWEPQGSQPGDYQQSGATVGGGQGATAWGQQEYGGQQTYGQQAYGQQTPGQPAYGQQTSGQPAYGRQTPGQPAYGQQTSGQPAYGRPGTQGYASPQPGYGPGQAAVPVSQVQAPRSPLLGMIALGVVVVCGVIFCWLMWRLGAVIGPIMVSSGGRLDNDELAQLMMDQLGPGGTLAMNLAAYGGLAGWITGMVAAGTRRGRSYGVWAIILGILAPIVGMIMMVAALMPYVG